MKTLRHRQRIALVPVELFSIRWDVSCQWDNIQHTPKQNTFNIFDFCANGLFVCFCIHPNIYIYTIHWLNWKCLSRGVIKPLHKTRLLDVVDYADLFGEPFSGSISFVSFKSSHLYEFPLGLSCFWYCTHICTHFVYTLESSTHTHSRTLMKKVWRL